MNEFYTYFILFSSAFIGGLAVILFRLKFSTNLKLLISYSGALILAICILHLIPEIFSNYTKQIGLFVLLGFLFQLLLDFFSEGIEHGHFHSHSKKLVAFPYAIFISLCVHSFIEGMALIEDNNDTLLIGIVIHNIPIAIVLGTMLLSKNISKTIFLTSLFVFSISSPLGLFLATYQIVPLIENSNILLALVVGIFLHISTTILFETSDSHKFELKKFIIIILGFITAFFMP
ncbi:MAG: zinc/iron permease [Flavobacteriales bacterium CG_4_9_14_3_um_filter_32_8]|nr:MAG: zinc/iron permease [Flavobacteriales bacterium CG_4_9_14_3_um_filter_32_8]